VTAERLPEARPRRWQKVRVILNANAGSKGGISTNGKDPDELRDLIERAGLGDDILTSSTVEEARDLTRDAVRRRFDVVVAVGGDGTIGTIADELIGTDTALGILPLGSIMNIPRMLGLPREVDEAVEVLANGVVRTVDVGEANGRTFYEAGSVGMNAAMFREAQRFDRGDYLSVLRTIWVAFRYRPARMEIQLDDRRIRTRALMVTVSNGPYTGAGMTVAPDARVDDGSLDVCVFRHFSKIELLTHLATIAFGRRRYSPHVRAYRSRRVRITSATPLPCRADSNDLGTTPAEFVTKPRALRVVVAAGFDARATGSMPTARVR
jgi:diacylglycerol kinase (ATP)